MGKKILCSSIIKCQILNVMYQIDDVHAPGKLNNSLYLGDLEDFVISIDHIDQCFNFHELHCSQKMQQTNKSI